MPPKTPDLLSVLERTADQFVSRDELARRLKSGKKLRVKYGVDIRTTDLHIGHAINLWTLRALQDQGHKIVFVFSDLTARIGDLDGRLETLSDLPEDDIRRTMEDFIAQARGIVRFDSPELVELRRNSEWYGAMPVQKLLSLLTLVTQAKVMAFDDFQIRKAEGREIYLHEILYLVMHGYDSVVVEADLAVTGSDQFFSESLGRMLQEKHKKPPQTIIATTVTPGSDGRHKQSALLNNHIALRHSPRDKFGRVMSIVDPLIEDYFRVYTDLPATEIATMRPMMIEHPRDAKLKLAEAIVARYHGPITARNERKWFENTISGKHIPDDIPTLTLMTPHIETLDLVALARPGKSKSDSRRLIRQGGVEINQRRLQKPEEELHLSTNDVLKVGRRAWFRIEIVRLNDLETENLHMTPMTLHDMRLMAAYIPQWDIVQYLGRHGRRKMTAPMTEDVFKNIILQQEPRSAWLWKVTRKDNPKAIVGIAHLRRDPRQGNQNIWLVPGAANEEGTADEIMRGVTLYAFEQLGFKSMAFHDAFSLATAPKEGEFLYNRMRSMSGDKLSRDFPSGTWGFTREGWEKMQQWRREVSPGLFSAENPAGRRNKKPVADKDPPAPA